MPVGPQGDDLQISDLPACAYTTPDGERELQARAERYLNEQVGQDLLASGLMPLISHRHRSTVTVMRLQSLAEPAQSLPLPD